MSDRGSALMLVPAGVLVLVVLAAIAVDSSLVFLGEREVANAAAAAANDAATVAVDVNRLRSDDCFDLVPERAVAVARAAAERQGDAVEVRPEDVVVAVDDVEVRVTITGTVRHLFARAVPGAPERSTVSATAVAELRTAGVACDAAQAAGGP